jgi:hypothetical protein
MPQDAAIIGSDMQNRAMSDAYMLRLPNGWRDAIKARAAGNRRSMNQEILIALEGLIGEAAGEDFGEDAPAAGADGNSTNRGVEA